MASRKKITRSGMSATVSEALSQRKERSAWLRCALATKWLKWTETQRAEMAAELKSNDALIRAVERHYKSND